MKNKHHKTIDDHITNVDLQNFNNLKNTADQISDLKERKLFYAKCFTLLKEAQHQGDVQLQITDELSLIDQTIALSPTEEQKYETAEIKSAEVASIKVRTVVVLELLKKMQAGLAHNDRTKICRLIAFLTGNSYHKIRNELQKGVYLSNFHRPQIDQVNKILSELNISISICEDIEY